MTVIDSPVARRSALSAGRGRLLALAYAVLLIAGAVLLFVVAVGQTGGALFGSLGQAIFWFATAYAIITTSNRAPAMLKGLVVLSGIGTVMRGLIPLEILLWGLNFWFVRWYARAVRDHEPAVHVRGAGPQTL